MNAPFSHPHLGPAALQFLSGPHQLFIGGRFVDAKAGKTFDTYDPSSGRVIAKVAAGEAADIDAAVTAARHGIRARSLEPHDRERAREADVEACRVDRGEQR